MSQQRLKRAIHKFFGFQLHDYQLAFVHDCFTNKRVVGVFCRQTGKSLCISFVAILEALRNPGENILIFGPTDRQVGELFDKISLNLRNSALTSQFDTITKREARLKNGARIIAATTGDTGSGIRSLTGKVIIEEEASYIKDSIHDEVITPMGAATDAKYIKIGTPFGMNHFYESAFDKNWILHQYNHEVAIAAGQITQKFIDMQRGRLTDLKFRTEYGAEFIPDEDAYFKTATIQGATEDIKQLDELKHPKNDYYLGVDFARMGQDKSVFIVIEKDWQTEELQVVKIVETKHKFLTDAIGRVQALDQRFKFRKIMLDETGLGAGATDVLKEKLGTRIVGVRFTVKSKEDIYSNLKVLMQKGKLKFPPHEELLFELRDLRYEYTASNNMKIHHSERGHDDFTDALALAVYEFRPRRTWKPGIYIPKRR